MFAEILRGWGAFYNSKLAPAKAAPKSAHIHRDWEQGVWKGGEGGKIMSNVPNIVFFWVTPPLISFKTILLAGSLSR